MVVRLRQVRDCYICGKPVVLDKAQYIGQGKYRHKKCSPLAKYNRKSKITNKKCPHWGWAAPYLREGCPCLALAQCRAEEFKRKEKTNNER